MWYISLYSDIIMFSSYHLRSSFKIYINMCLLKFEHIYTPKHILLQSHLQFGCDEENQGNASVSS